MTAATQSRDAGPTLSGPASQRGAHKTGSGARSILQQISHCVVALALAAASYFLISHCLLQSVRVVGRSMVPTLHDSDNYLLNRWVYHFRAPKHSDVVV